MRNEADESSKAKISEQIMKELAPGGVSLIGTVEKIC